MDNRVITEQQGDALNVILKDILTQADADAVFICDCGGNIVGHVTHRASDTDQTIAALASGSFAATGELAALIGEPTFRSIYHKGDRASIYMQNLGRDYLMLVIFGPRTTLGMIKLYIEHSTAEIEALLSQMDGQDLQSSGAGQTFTAADAGPIFKPKPQPGR